MDLLLLHKIDTLNNNQLTLYKKKSRKLRDFFLSIFLSSIFITFVSAAIKMNYMKIHISHLSGIAFIAMISVFTSCKKPDTTAPVITLNGAASQTISLQGTYTELKALANDNKDGALTPTISGTVNVNHTGVYIITYRATDAAGNIGTATRTITVVNDIASMTGFYHCTGSTIYTDTITASPTVNKIID